MRSRTLILSALAIAAYARVLREPILTWGATAEEAAAALPGDELLPEPDGEATRAICDRRARDGGVAVARADGPGAARRRLHL